MSMYKEQVVLKGFDEQIRKLANYDRIARKHERGAMRKSVIVVASSVRPHTPVYRGTLRQSIGSEVVEMGSLIEGHIGSSLTGEVYPKVMEAGSQKGSFPPLGGLMRWVHLQLGVPTNRARKVAFAVAISIYRKGIKGRYMFKKGWEQSKPMVLGFFQAAGEKIVNDLAVK